MLVHVYQFYTYMTANLDLFEVSKTYVSRADDILIFSLKDKSIIEWIVVDTLDLD